MTTIHAKVIDQVLSATILPRVARGSQNAVTLHVDFCDKWSGYAKSAVFNTAHDPTPYEVPISAFGDCLVPPEVLADAGYLFIFIRGVKGNSIKSTTAIRYKILPGTPSLVVSDPTNDVYRELLTAYGKANSEIAAESVARQKEIAVERARIDALLKLADGSTTGDAELQDIRIDGDGNEHETAGGAVRSQFTANKNKIAAITKGANRIVYERFRLFQGGVLLEDQSVINSDEYSLTGFSGVVLYPIESMLPIVANSPAYNLIFELQCDVDSIDVNVAVTNHTWGSTSVKRNTKEKIYSGINYVELNLSNWDEPYENEAEGIVNKIAVYASSGYLDGVTVKGVYAIPKHGYGVMGYVSEIVSNREITKALVDFRSQWRNKSWVAYGDSITAQCNGNELTNGWAKYVNSRHEFSRFYGRGVGGQRYCYNTGTWYANTDGTYAGRYGQNGLTEAPEGTTTHNGSFCSWDRITTMIPEDIRESIDLITIMGGTNDISAGINETWSKPAWSAENTADDVWRSDTTHYNGGDYDTSTLVGSVASTIMKMQTWCPNAVIVVLTPIPRWVEYAHYENKGLTLQDVSEMIRKTAEYMGVHCVDLNAKCGINGFNYAKYISDGVHPNANGHKLIGQALNGSFVDIFPRI